MSTHLIVVDDEALLRRSLVYNLEQAGYRVSSAGRAEDALALARRDPPDLVLLDIGLPSMDGLQALRIFRQEVGCPVIFVTARRRELDEQLGLELGADDYISKPFRSMAYTQPSPETEQLCRSINNIRKCTGYLMPRDPLCLGKIFTARTVSLIRRITGNEVKDTLRQDAFYITHINVIYLKNATEQIKLYICSRKLCCSALYLNAAYPFGDLIFKQKKRNYPTACTQIAGGRRQVLPGKVSQQHRIGPKGIIVTHIN
jgi:CheY-like chemotaxis protein